VLVLVKEHDGSAERPLVETEVIFEWQNGRICFDSKEAKRILEFDETTIDFDRTEGQSGIDAARNERGGTVEKIRVRRRRKGCFQ